MELQFGTVGTGCCCQSPKPCWAFELPLFSLFLLFYFTPSLCVSLFLTRTGVAANQPLILALQGAVTLHCGKLWTSWLKLEHVGKLMLWHRISMHPMTYEQACQDIEPLKGVLFYSFSQLLNGLEWQPRSAELDKNEHLLSFLFWICYYSFFWNSMSLHVVSSVTCPWGTLEGFVKSRPERKVIITIGWDMRYMSSYFRRNHLGQNETRQCSNETFFFLISVTYSTLKS